MNRKLLTLLCSLLAAWTCPVRADDAADRELLERIQAVWQARAEQIQTVEAEWEDVTVTFARTGNGPNSTPVPAEDFSVTNTGVMWIDGDRFRVRPRDTCYVHFLDRVVTEDLEFAFDGEEYTSFNRRYIESRWPMLGNIIGNKPWQVGTPQISPWGTGIMACFRPWNDPFYNLLSGEWEVADEPAVHDGVRCIVLREMHGRIERHRALVSDDSEFRLLELSMPLNTPVPSIVHTFTYRDDAEHGYLPVAWERVLQPFGEELESAYTCTVTSLKVNEPLASATFRVDFPPRTLVGVRGEGYAVVLDDGEMRPVTRAEYRSGLTYEELAATPPPPESAHIEEALNGRSWTWYLVMAGVVIAGLYFALRTSAARNLFKWRTQ